MSIPLFCEAAPLHSMMCNRRLNEPLSQVREKVLTNEGTCFSNDCWLWAVGNLDVIFTMDEALFQLLDTITAALAVRNVSENTTSASACANAGNREAYHCYNNGSVFSPSTVVITRSISSISVISLCRSYW